MRDDNHGDSDSHLFAKMGVYHGIKQSHPYAKSIGMTKH